MSASGILLKIIVRKVHEYFEYSTLVTLLSETLYILIEKMNTPGLNLPPDDDRLW